MKNSVYVLTLREDQEVGYDEHRGAVIVASSLEEAVNLFADEAKFQFTYAIDPKEARVMFIEFWRSASVDVLENATDRSPQVLLTDFLNG